MCGTCGENVFWDYNGAGVLTISGNGKMDDYSTYQSQYSTDYISSPWFDWSSEIVSCIIQDGVTNIGISAFAFCTAMTDVTIADSVTSIGKGAFYECDSLTEIHLPDSVNNIGEFAFAWCNELSSINIPFGVTHVRRETFSGCTSLHSIALPDSITTIEWYALSCRIETLNIPASVTEIEDNGIEGAPNLRSIQVDKNNQTFSSQNGVLFSKDKTQLIRYPRAKKGDSYTIPDSVTSICKDAFFCTELMNITIPDSVSEIGSSAFAGCQKLTCIDLPKNLMRIAPGMFFECDNLESIYIPANVIQIDELAFNFCPSLKKVYYGGTREQWKAIIKERNDDLPKDDDIICESDDNSLIPLRSCDRKLHIIEGIHSPQAIVTTQKSQKYNPELAYTLSVLVSGAYDYKITQYNFNLLGFNDSKKCRLYFNDEVYKLTWQDEAEKYNWMTTMDKVGYGIGQMQLDNGDLLVLVVIRGTFAAPTEDDKSVLLLGNEWQSDYNIVWPTIFGSGLHTGFHNAEEEVMADLERVMSGIKTENVKYVITGHSRGAAVANLLEKDLMDRGVSGDDVYGYNFACPDVAKESPSSFNPKGEYNNIYNICIAGDPVSVVPGMFGDELSTRFSTLNMNSQFTNTWGKYGQSGWFCRDWNSYEETGLDLTFKKHRSENYVDMMSNRYSFTKTKSWLEYKANVLISMLPDTFKNESSAKSNIKVGKSNYEIPYDKSGQFLKDQTMCRASFHCPIDVEIVNSEGVVLASVIGDEVTYSDNAANDLQVLVMKDGDEKYFTVIGNEDYHFNLTGTDTGEMTAIISVQPACMLQSPTVTYYENVPLTAGKQMSLDVSSDLTEYGESMTVYDESGTPAETIAPVIAEQSNIYGDMNQDNDLTVSDAVLLARMVAEDAEVEVSEDAVFLSDVNRDGILTSADTAALLNLLTCKLTDEQ